MTWNEDIEPVVTYKIKNIAGTKVWGLGRKVLQERISDVMQESCFLAQTVLSPPLRRIGLCLRLRMLGNDVGRAWECVGEVSLKLRNLNKCPCGGMNWGMQGAKKTELA